MSVSPMPEEYPGVTAYLVVKDGAEALDWYVRAFGAGIHTRIDGPDGSLMHAEVVLGGGRFMMASEFPDMDFHAPGHYGGSPISLLFYTEDVDAVFARAIAEGATELRPIRDQFYGDRSGALTDPFGHVWTIATHLEDLSEEELRARTAEAMKECGE